MPRLRHELGVGADRWQRRLRAGLAVLTVLVILGGVGGLVLLRPATPVTVGDAVSRFRASSRTTKTSPLVPRSVAGRGTSTPGTESAGAMTGPPDPVTSSTSPATPPPTRSVGPPGSALTTTPTPATQPSAQGPADGVYVYNTTGYESIDALGGQRRDFPPQTTVTVKSAACGFTQRWEPFDQHWEQSDICVSAQMASLREYLTYVSFDGQADQQDFLCPQGAYVRLARAQQGERWSYSCSSSNTKLQVNAQVVGFEDIVVGGANVHTVHIHLDATLSGQANGTSPEDVWLSTANTLMIRSTGSADMHEQTSFGDVHYQEQYSLQLTNLTPQQ